MPIGYNSIAIVPMPTGYNSIYIITSALIQFEKTNTNSRLVRTIIDPK